LVALAGGGDGDFFDRGLGLLVGSRRADDEDLKREGGREGREGGRDGRVRVGSGLLIGSRRADEGGREGGRENSVKL